MITPITIYDTPLNKAIVDDTHYRVYSFIRFNSFKVENNLNVIYRIDSMILNTMWDKLRVHVTQIHWDGMIIKIKK